MTARVRNVLIVGATVTPMVLLGTSAQAAPETGMPAVVVTVKPSPKPKPKPPTTTGKGTREGLRLHGTTTKQDSRLGEAPPPKRKRARPAAHTVPPKEKQATTADNHRDFRLNVGTCGLVQRDGTVPGPNRCQIAWPEERRTEPPEVVPPRPQDVTWEQVLTETKDVLFPEGSVKVQPKGRTLVNLDTIVYTDKREVSTMTVTLLGFPEVVEATPQSYTWSFGDGTTLATSTPGNPYPSKDVTHKYLKRGAVSLTVTIHYTASFNVAGTGPQYVDGTIPVTGPVTPLQVREAVPVLVGPPVR